MEENSSYLGNQRQCATSKPPPRDPSRPPMGAQAGPNIARALRPHWPTRRQLSGRTQLPRVFPLFFSFAASSTRLPSSSFQFQRPRGGRRESLSSSLTLSPIAGIHTGLNISSIPTVTSKRTEKSQVLANLHVRHIYHRLLLFRVRENTPVLPHQALHMAMNSLRRCTKRESWLARRDAETAHR